MKRVVLILFGVIALGALSSCKTSSYKYKTPQGKKQKKNCNCPKFSSSKPDMEKTYTLLYI